MFVLCSLRIIGVFGILVVAVISIGASTTFGKAPRSVTCLRFWFRNWPHRFDTGRYNTASRKFVNCIRHLLTVPCLALPKRLACNAYHAANTDKIKLFCLVCVGGVNRMGDNTRWFCLVTNSLHTADTDKTRQFCVVRVGGVK